MEDFFTLITGRTKGQAHGLHIGAGSPAHLEATSFIEIGPEDMTRLGIKDGQIVRLRSDAGQVEAPVHSGNLPSGLVFIPMGPTANVLVGTDTFGTGMPSFKGLRVKLELI
ncbi:MAG: formylmethanofuran dehydrogenase [Desulfobacteraceae bacterium]|nr:formylmethanofuran dehydrogenase [Desulfobacteraceae bacterium]